MCGMPPALAVPGWAVLKRLMDLVFVLLQHLQSRASVERLRHEPVLSSADALQGACVGFGSPTDGITLDFHL